MFVIVLICDFYVCFAEAAIEGRVRGGYGRGLEGRAREGHGLGSGDLAAADVALYDDGVGDELLGPVQAVDVG